MTGVALFVASLATAGAQAPGTGAIAGRVAHATKGEYLERARLTVEGTNLEAFSDDTGHYRLTNVPAGPARVRAFFTGLAAQTSTVAVAAGGTARLDFNLEGFAPDAAASAETVKLETFVVSTSREMDGAAIAINEQRFARNIINVISADEFGMVAEGNVGEFLKFVPGVVVDYRAGDARAISINGVPPDNVPVTVGGFNLASAASSSTGRPVETEQVSINNISRIEVTHAPTPETSGAALAGAINMVPRSAFERSRPSYSGSVHLMMRDNDRSFRKTPGPLEKRTRKVLPGFDFTAIVPVSPRFGFTLSGSTSTQYNPWDFAENTWRGLRQPTTGLTAATAATQYPDTTPDTPYLSQFLLRAGTRSTTRSSAASTVDVKVGPAGRLSFSMQYTFFDSVFNNRTMTFLMNRVAAANLSSRNTYSETGGAEITLANGAREKSGTTVMPTLTYRYDGRDWKGEAGLGYSRASNHYRDIDKGHFQAGNARRTGLTMAFLDNWYLRPGSITVTDAATGAPVDPYNVNTYALTTSNSAWQESSDLQRTAFANLRRDLDVRGVPVSLKAGLDVRQSVRDIRGVTTTYTFVGPDGRASTNPTVGNSDDGAGRVFDRDISTRGAPWGFPHIQWTSNEQLWRLYQSNPNWFTVDRNNAYLSQVLQSKLTDEVVSSAYFRADAQFFQRRLKLVGGVRAEQTNVYAEGPLSDATLNYQRDSAGRVVLGANGRPLTITSDPLRVLELTRLDRGQVARKEYLRVFPSLNASFDLRDNLILRGAHYWSLGRPNLNQYAGGITLPDTEFPPSPTNRITVENAGIKAWKAETTKLTLEYYFGRVGLLSIGVWRRDFTNFFGRAEFETTPEFLALYGLDPNEFGAYRVNTQYNLTDKAHMNGLEFNYKQALTFLPRWARGVQINSNVTSIRTRGAAGTNFSLYNLPLTANWGVSLWREKYNVRCNWNYRGRTRLFPFTGRGIEPSVYSWHAKRLYIDVNAEYVISKRLTAFANLRNLQDTPVDVQLYGPSTPAHANFHQREQIGGLWTFGLKGSF